MSNTTRTTRSTRKSASTPDAGTVAPSAPAEAVAPSVAPDVTPDEVTPDTTPDAAPDEAPDEVTPDTTPDAASTPAPVGPVAYVIPTIAPDADDDTRTAYIATVGQAYRDADKSNKASMRAAWAKYRSAAFDVMDVFQLTLYRDVDRVMVSAPVRAEVDPTDAYVSRIVALHLAADQLTNTFAMAHPDRFEVMMSRVHNGTWDTLSDDAAIVAGVTMADKLATIAGGGTRRTGPQRSVEAHIRSALESVPSGTVLTCAQVTNHRSEEYGPDDAPSVGAVGAVWGREVDGIDTDATNTKGTKGFRLIPVPVATDTDADTDEV